jgi:hypothetical protein
MSREVWFQLVDGEGNLVTSVDRVKDLADDAKVVDLRDAVKVKCPINLANVDAADLTVFANGVALDPRHSLAAISKKVTFIVQVPQRAENAPNYFILPQTREKVDKAVFVIVEEDKDDKSFGMGVFKGVGMGVFFSATLAVTCAHNLSEQTTVGSSVSLALKEEMADVIVVAHNSELDFAILKSSKPRSFIAPWNGSTDDLESRWDLVLASFRLGIDENQEPFKGKLGFAPAACIAISSHRRHIMFSCPMYTGDSGAALILKDECLVGIHQETINALREEMDRKKLIKDRLNDVEESLDNIARSGLAQGCSGLLVHVFKNVVNE